MPTRGETYRQTWVDPKYELFQANIERAMAEDVRLREDLALQRQFIEKRILQAEKAVDALEKQEAKSIVDAVRGIGGSADDERAIERIFDSKRENVRRLYDVPSGLEGRTNQMVTRATSKSVLAQMKPEDIPKAVFRALMKDDVRQEVLAASPEARLRMANDLAFSLMGVMPDVSSETIRVMAAAAMSTTNSRVDPRGVTPGDFASLVDKEAFTKALGETNALRIRSGMSPLNEQLRKVDPATGKPVGESLRERAAGSASSKEVGTAKTDLEKLILERTRLTKEAAAPSESDLRQRAIEMNIDIFRKRKDRKPPKDPAELIMFLGRDAVQYLQDNDPTTDGSKAGMLATQIQDLISSGTMREDQLLTLAGQFAGKDTELRNEIITRVLAHAFKADSDVAADPEAVLKPADDPMEVAKEAMKEQAQQQLQAVERGVEEAKTRLKDAASTPPMPAQASGAGGAFSGPDQVIASLPLNAQQQEMAQLIYDKFTAAGIPEAAAYAAIVNAAAESSLDPSAQFQEASGSMAVGLFQLNDAPGAMGEGLSLQDRLDPSFNIDRMIEAIQGPQGERFLVGAQSGVQSIDELTAIFTEDLERPANRTQKGAERAATASEWFGRGVISPTQARADTPTPPAPRTGVERQTEARQIRNTQAFDARRIEDFRALLAETTDPIERADLQRTIEGLTKESEVAQAEIDALIQAAPRADRRPLSQTRTRLFAPTAPAGADMGAAREGVATKKAQVQAEIDRLKGLSGHVTTQIPGGGQRFGMAVDRPTAGIGMSTDIAGQQREINKEIARQQQLLDHLQRMEETTLVGEAAPAPVQTALDDDGILISRTGI